MSTPSDAATAIQSFASTLLASIADPSDAIRIFTALNNFSAATYPQSSAVGLDQTVVAGCTADLCRRTAAIALAQASSIYQPTSQNDAQNIQSVVCDILDAEILIAGDQGLDETFYALKALRIAVAEDLTARGSVLPDLQTYTTNMPMPALVLSDRYYRDITRNDQLIASANPKHPAFMPVIFTALSS